jgi:UDP-N-acetylglucosamine 4,6-dehydratase
MTTDSSTEWDPTGKAILVTGGTGSFGRCFVRTVISRYRPRKLIIFSRDEMKQYEMAHEWSVKDYPFLRYFIGDVRDRDRLQMAMRDVDYVIHAAALKHVPAAEYNPFECVLTNVHGAENVVNAAIGTGVKKVIALSTDKAVNPINLYGATKLAADKIFVAANSLSGLHGTRFAVVRYGNVVASRGSVVELFRRLIDEGVDSLPITDPRMTRFWITIRQGVDFVLSCFRMMSGGEIFVPKIPSMKITDLARAMAPQLSHHTIGIRPGEKLHEVLITEDDARSALELTDRYIIEPVFTYWSRHPYTEVGARTVAEGFRYDSNLNSDWLNAERLQRLLKEVDA